ncbi:hypothetical protein CDAR_169401 [Caerostris darwini]|uniref:Uncharacterized protein n=1 Tax=Caerostris darwini TaxID=1538125 RepID=A0AAV4QLC7_9ARAC|nr:hypothetical protein CDAR_169401 [Caerostris darwini]
MRLLVRLSSGLNDDARYYRAPIEYHLPSEAPIRATIPENEQRNRRNNITSRTVVTEEPDGWAFLRQRNSMKQRLANASSLYVFVRRP